MLLLAVISLCGRGRVRVFCLRFDHPHEMLALIKGFLHLRVNLVHCAYV